MGSEYDKLRKRMGDGHDPVPPEFNWEHMEEGIMNKMEELQANKPSSRKWYRRIRFGLLLLLLFFVGCGIQFVTQPDSFFSFVNGPQKTTDKQNIPAVPSSTVENDVSDSKSLTPATPNKQQSNKEVQMALTRKDQSNSSTQTVASDGPGTNLDANNTASKNSNQGSLPPKGILHTESTLPTTSNSTMEMDKAAKEEVEQTSNLKDGTPFPQVQTEPLRSIPTISFTIQQNQQHKLAIALPQEKDLSAPASKEQRPPENRISLQGGIIGWDMGYGTIKPERAPYEKTIPSWQAQVDYQYIFKKGWIMSAGIQLVQLEHRFDWQTTIEDYDLTLEDTILQWQTNVLTGQQAAIRGNVDVTTSATRSVRHYNVSRLVQVPVAIGKTWQFNRWEAGVMAGGALTIFSSSHGRTLSGGQVLDYDGSSNPMVDNTWSVHGLLRGQLTYRLHKSIGVTTGFQVQKSLTNWSTEPNIRMRPELLSWQVGVTYTW